MRRPQAISAVEHINGMPVLEVGRAWAQAQAQLFHLFSKAWARSRLKPDFCSEFFKHKKPKPKVHMKPEPNQSSKKSGPAHL
jgi:hypothetical protein